MDIIGNAEADSHVQHLPYSHYKHLHELDLDSLKQKLLSDIKWERVVHGGRELRKSAWYVEGNCTCRYKYGSIESHPEGFAPNEFPEFLKDLSGMVREIFGYKDNPDACNLNLYETGDNVLGFHADNEALFRGKQGEAEIISLSLGSTRRFTLRDNFTKELYPIDIEEGDIVAMRKLTQRSHEHCVEKGSTDLNLEPRINLTFRFILNHGKRCKKIAN